MFALQIERRRQRGDGGGEGGGGVGGRVKGGRRSPVCKTDHHC